MKKYFSNKKNCRQLIIAGIIAVFTAEKKKISFAIFVF
jgi:hypothetical protein